MERTCKREVELNEQRIRLTLEISVSTGILGRHHDSHPGERHVEYRGGLLYSSRALYSTLILFYQIAHTQYSSQPDLSLLPPLTALLPLVLFTHTANFIALVRIRIF